MPHKTDKLFIIIDGSSYLHRAFHALPKLITSTGQNTGAIYGVIKMVKKIIHNYCPQYITIVFDAKDKCFRHKIYPNYKATRPPMAAALKEQIAPLYEIIDAMGISIQIIAGEEADDVIGTLARLASNMMINTMISSCDKDFAQLVDNNITLINTMNSTVLNVVEVKNKFGVYPKQITDYLTLVGDRTDNIAGISGIGPKTATKLLSKYHTLSNIIENKDAIQGKSGKNFRENISCLTQIKTLVTIRDELSLNIDITKLVQKNVDNTKLHKIFTKLEFNSWLKPLDQSRNIFPNVKSCNIILKKNDFLDWLKKINIFKRFAFTTICSNHEHSKKTLAGLSFSVAPENAIYIPLSHNYTSAPKQLRLKDIIYNIQQIFSNPEIIKIGQCLKQEFKILADYGIEIIGTCYDITIESYVLDNSNNQHNIENLANRHLGKAIMTYENLVGKGVKKIPFHQVEPEKIAFYATNNSDIVLQLHDIMWSQIEKKDNTKEIFKKIDMPLVSVLSRIEKHGVRINKNILNNLSSKIALKLQDLEDKIYKEAGIKFNINSPKQLQEILYFKLNLPTFQKTRTGKFSTSEPILRHLSTFHLIPKLLLEYRSLSKIKSTYTDALPKTINTFTNKIHTSYQQTATTTGRLSSINPNLQNIPIRTAEGREIRKSFVADTKHKLISVDYSQIELRIMAHISKDKNLILAFKQGKDIHQTIAAEIFKIPINSITNEIRQKAKTINYGLIYGMSAFGLARMTRINHKEAQKYMTLYFERYPQVKTYMEEIKNFARSHGYVESIFGRKLYIKDILTENFMNRTGAERAAINAPIQGSAADIIKIGMIKIDTWIKKCTFEIAMIMQVHDELVFEVDNKYSDYAVGKIKNALETIVDLDVPLVINYGIGNNWDEVH